MRAGPYTPNDMDGARRGMDVRDDGRGFDTRSVPAGKRPDCGFQVMPESAELIGAGFEVRSRPDGVTTVRPLVPTGEEGT
jgi:signal transduction histidine kinase